jgi:hypothetical protein
MIVQSVRVADERCDTYITPPTLAVEPVIVQRVRVTEQLGIAWGYSWRSTTPPCWDAVESVIVQSVRMADENQWIHITPP